MKRIHCTKCAQAQERATEALGLLNDAQAALVDERAINAGLTAALEAAQREVAGLRRFKAGVDEALNSGDGVYRP